MNTIWERNYQARTAIAGVNWELERYAENWDVSIIIDLTEAVAISLQIAVQAADFHIPLYVVIGGSLAGNPHREMRAEGEAKACGDLLGMFQWEKFNVITTEGEITAGKIVERFPQAERFTIAEGATYKQVEAFVGRLIKPSGRQYFLLTTPTLITSQLLRIFKSKRLFEPGNLYILGSMNDRLPPSLLQSLGSGLLAFSLFDRVPTDAIDRTYLTISSIFVSNSTQFALFNSQMDGGEYALVGRCGEGGCRLKGNLIFPGGTTNIPSKAESSVMMSLPTNYTDANEQAAVIHVYGAVAAIEDINRRSDILPNFVFEHQTYYFGIVNFDISLALSNAARLNYHFGSVVANGIDNTGIISLFRLFHEANMTVPIIASESPYGGFSNTTEFPFFVRTIVSDTYTAATYAQILRLFGWKRCVVVHEAGLGITGFVENFQKAAQLCGITIVNSQDLGLLPDDFPTQPIDTYLPLFTSLLSTKVRIILIVSITRSIIDRVIVSLYKAGARRGDILIVGVAWIVDGVWEFMRGENYAMYAELMPGAIIAFPMTYVGKEGLRIKADLVRGFQVDPPAGMCLFYDSAMLVGRALDFLITTGNDPEDPIIVTRALRTTKFIGCSGMVSIDPGSNDRSQMDFVVQNLKYFDGNDTWRLDNVLRFAPTSGVMVTRLGNFTWPDGSSITPSDTFEYDINCPFPSRDLRPSSLGRVILMTVAYSVAIATGVVTMTIWRKWWRKGMEELVEKCEISVNDVVVLLSILIEFLQYISLGPSSQSLTSTLQLLGETVTLDFQSAFHFQRGTFWLLLDVVFFGAFAWLWCLVMIYFDLWTKLRGVCFVQTMEQVADFAMPLLGNLCFLPIISMLTDVFQCDEATGDSLSDTILFPDCYQHCWVYPHSLYVTVSILSLIIYVPTAVFCRPLWQEFQADLHVKTLPGFLMIKTIFQITLIVLSKTVKRIWPLAHAGAYTAFGAVFAGLTLWKKPFNYSRPNLWQFTLALMVVWLGLISAISLQVPNQPSALLSALFLGWAVAVVVSFLVQVWRYPSKLYRKKGRDIGMLFKFQLSKAAVDPKTIQHCLNKVTPTKSGDTVI